MFQLPEPGHINVRMAHCMNRHRAGPGNPGNLLVPDFQSVFQRCIKSIGARFSPVNRQMCTINSCLKISSYGIVLIQHTHSLNSRSAAVIEIIRNLIQNGKFCLFELMCLWCWYPAAFQSCPETDGKLHFCAGKL